MSWTDKFRNLLSGGSESDAAPAEERVRERRRAPQPRRDERAQYDHYEADERDHYDHYASEERQSYGRSMGDERSSYGAHMSRPSFDAIGQRDETLRQRVGAMIDRLDDLKSLQGDFAEILSPLVQISDEFSRASIRIVELEALLGQERQAGSHRQEEISSLAVRLTSLGNQLSDMTSRAEVSELELGDRNAAIDELRIELGEKMLTTENLERQLFSENEQNKALIGENKALRAEAQSVDSALARSEHDLLGARERLGTFEMDNRRLQTLTEEQGAQLAELSARYRDLDSSADLDRQRARTIESQLAIEAAARERAEAQFETELSALRTERASFAMKLESAENRASATQQMLNQTRNQLREKDEAFRVADRNFKEASIARSTSDRRFEAVQADLARQTERFVDLQRLRTDLEARCDMLSKALAAKDAALEQAAGRNGHLTDRIEQLTSRHEATRAEFETANRRLLEDLQNERSERALMQGALEIARESRVTLQKQHDALKRAGRAWRETQWDDQYGDQHDGRAHEPSNVRPFTSNSKPA